MSYLTRTSPRRPDRPVGSRAGPIRPARIYVEFCGAPKTRRRFLTATQCDRCLDENGQEDESPGESSALAAMAGGRKGGGDADSVPVPLLRPCALGTARGRR
jgi:hypothetical protein